MTSNMGSLCQIVGGSMSSEGSMCQIVGSMCQIASPCHQSCYKSQRHLDWAPPRKWLIRLVNLAPHIELSIILQQVFAPPSRLGFSELSSTVTFML